MNQDKVISSVEELREFVFPTVVREADSECISVDFYAINACYEEHDPNVLEGDEFFFRRTDIPNAVFGEKTVEDALERFRGKNWCFDYYLFGNVTVQGDNVNVEVDILELPEEIEGVEHCADRYDEDTKIFSVDFHRDKENAVPFEFASEAEKQAFVEFAMQEVEKAKARAAKEHSFNQKGEYDAR